MGCIIVKPSDDRVVRAKYGKGMSFLILAYFFQYIFININSTICDFKMCLFEITNSFLCCELVSGWHKMDAVT